MKLKILDTKAEEKGSVELPKQFDEEYRPDLIKRAVLAIQSHNYSSYGAKEGAGMRSSAQLSKRRRKYRGMYGKGISRTPRKILTRRGTQMHMVGAVSPNTIGGRRAHPPKTEKKIEHKINKKENRKAIRSALGASINAEIVSKRGHKLPETFPFIISDEFESIKKSSEVKKALEALGMQDEIERGDNKKIRAGKGKLRGRRYKKPKSLLFVISKKCDLEKSAKNLAGIDIVNVKDINAEMLAPGTAAGRAALFTESSIKEINDKKLFLN